MISAKSIETEDDLQQMTVGETKRKSSGLERKIPFLDICIQGVFVAELS